MGNYMYMYVAVVTVYGVIGTKPVACVSLQVSLNEAVVYLEMLVGEIGLAVCEQIYHQ